MNFELSDDQRALVDTVEKFAGSDSAKRPATDSADTATSHTVARWDQMAELGLAGLTIAEEHGGIGLSVAEIVLVTEALGKSLAQEPFVSAGVVGPKLFQLSSSEAIQQSYLPTIAEGGMRVALAGDEIVHDFNPAQVSARVEQRDGSLRVSGTKELVIDGPAATHFAVTALSDSGDINVFLAASDQPGVTVTPLRGLDGGWMARVAFDGAEVEGPLFDVGEGLANLECALDLGTVALCAEALGLMDRMLALTADYLQNRQQFGKPIGTFQALQHIFADMVVAAEQARSGTLMAAAAMSEEDGEVRKRDVSAGKVLVCQHGRAVLEAAIQLHGGIGITDEYELSRYIRRMIEISKTLGDEFYHEARFAKAIGSR